MKLNSVAVHFISFPNLLKLFHFFTKGDKVQAGDENRSINVRFAHCEPFSGE